jgi:predicted RNA-binding Zn ribbon-like protein
MLTSVVDVADEDFLLELLNTTPVVDGVQRDDLATAGAGQTWLRAHGHAGSTGEWQSLRSARDALQAAVRGQGGSAAVLKLLDGVTSTPALSDQGVEWVLRAPTGRHAAVRAVLAWDGVRRARPGRLRPCENPECALFLLDRSKPNNARWCSMAACGNRMKARRHHERARAGQS